MTKKAKRAAAPEASASTPVLHVLSERFADPDLVDRIFDYVVQLTPKIAEKHIDELKEVRQEVREALATLLPSVAEQVFRTAEPKLRAEFTGEDHYIRRTSKRERAERFLATFNGRNATEVARELGLSRATVYRLLKQPGQKK